MQVINILSTRLDTNTNYSNTSQQPPQSEVPVHSVAQHQRGLPHAALPEQHHLEGEAAAPGRRAGPRRHPRPAAEPRLTSTGRTAAPPPPTGTRAHGGERPGGWGGTGEATETEAGEEPGNRTCPAAAAPLPLMAASSSYVTHRPVTRSPRRQWEGGTRRRREAPPPGPPSTAEGAGPDQGAGPRAGVPRAPYAGKESSRNPALGFPAAPIT
ncbi:translation initiation factor IF-2-like [Onychostruthus taczanowskii]|uniref:translation initiation factor IF-2-like n=1 Tax=Onychostruthus taczanowskii TaxID=356909 RepID=UPI001B80C6AD|nr:translation initiation factor IF-2-like [Onychostruthus taczanowskii]